MLWDGHSFDKDVKTSVVDRGYTDYSEKYALSEEAIMVSPVFYALSHKTNAIFTATFS